MRKRIGRAVGLLVALLLVAGCSKPGSGVETAKSPAESPTSVAEAPNTSAEAPKTVANAPASAVEAPKTTVEPPKTTPDPPKTAADPPKSTPQQPVTNPAPPQTTPDPPAAQPGLTEEQLRMSMVEVDGVVGWLSFAPVLKDGQIYLHGETMLRLIQGPGARDWGDGRLQEVPGYTIDAVNRTRLLRAGTEPLKPPYPIVVEGRVYLHIDSVKRAGNCQFQWAREQEPYRMVFQCRPGATWATQKNLWGSPAIVQTFAYPRPTDWHLIDVDPHWYPWSGSGHVAEIAVALPSELGDQGKPMNLEIRLEVQSAPNGIIAEVRKNGEDMGRMEVIYGQPGVITVPVSSYTDDVRIRVTSQKVAASRGMPMDQWTLQLK